MAEPFAVRSPQRGDLRISRLGRRLLRYALRRWRGLIAVGSVMGLDVLIGLLKPWPLKLLVDNVLSGKHLPSSVDGVFRALPGPATRDALLSWVVGATLVVFLLGWLVQLGRGIASIRFGRRMTYDVGRDLLAHLQRLSVRTLSQRRTGDLIRRVTTDAGCVSTIVQGAILPVVTSLVSLVAMALVMFRLDIALTVLALVVLPLLVVGLRRYSGPMARRGYEQQEAEARIYDEVEQSLSGIVPVQAFGLERRNDERFRGITDAALAAQLRATGAQLRFKVWVGAMTTLGTAAVMWLGAEHVIDGRLSVGDVLVFLSYLASMYGPLETVMYTSSTVQEAAGSVYRVLEVLETDPEVKDGHSSLGRVRGHVRVEDVEFGYDRERPVLRGVSLEASPGETVALVGSTGAGKSTVAGLLLRFFDPDAGRVVVDGIDVRDAKIADLRANISLVSQESFLFPISVADNIAYGRPGASRYDVMHAATLANADAFIRDLPDGYDTVVGERGATLSGGQRQRIAIARALLKDAPILVLDEPTSALDAETEHGLMLSLDRLMEGRTTFVIAHRLSTVRDADRIYVLDRGRVVESGSHRDLLAAGGVYAALSSTAGVEVAEPPPPAAGAGRGAPVRTTS